MIGKVEQHLKDEISRQGCIHFTLLDLSLIHI